MNINTSLRLSKDQYYSTKFTKKQIYLHHTIGGSALSTFEYWQKSTERIGTAYLVERDGTIYQVFDDEGWAYHLGLKIIGNTKYNRESIGIELCSEGALRSGQELNKILLQSGIGVKFLDNYLYAFDIDKTSTGPITWFKNAKKLYNIQTDIGKYYDNHDLWRGYRYFDAYEDLQLEAVFELIKYLCEKFSIPKKLIAKDKSGFDLNLLGIPGILCHANVRIDKTDVSVAFPWKKLEKYLL